ncbi:MAG: hypothetical protein QOG03_1571, partial [Actinomycetota bacterium]|nr:hypothetical protein [Actinomycetota bacterium]
AAQVHESRAFLRNQVAHLFAPELAGDRAVLLAAVDALCSFETYELLRTDQGLSPASTSAALVAALTTLLEPIGVESTSNRPPAGVESTSNRRRRSRSDGGRG